LEQERPDLLKRRDWFDGQLDRDPVGLVFIDETGLSTKMSELRGRSLCGERCRAAIPHCQWKTTTFNGALRHSAMTAPMVLYGTMNGTAFRAYVEQVLVPTPMPCNLPAHKADGVRQAIGSAGCQLLHLPPCSPEFTPIEKAFCTLKVLLRALAKHNVESLWDAVGEIIQLFKPKDCGNYFASCGHEPELSGRAVTNADPEA